MCVQNHGLTFIPIDERRCRDADEIETHDALWGFATGVFIRLMFRYRHRRWREYSPDLASCSPHRQRYAASIQGRPGQPKRHHLSSNPR
jgi:hypothetical protein